MTVTLMSQEIEKRIAQQIIDYCRPEGRTKDDLITRFSSEHHQLGNRFMKIVYSLVIAGKLHRTGATRASVYRTIRQ